MENGKKKSEKIIQEIREWIAKLLILFAIPEKEAMTKALEEMGGYNPIEHLRAVVIAVINIFGIAAKEPPKMDDFISQLPRGKFSEIVKAKPDKIHMMLELTFGFISQNAVIPADPKVPDYAKEYVGSVLAILYLVHAAGEGPVGEKDTSETLIYSEANALLVLFREAMVFARKNPENAAGVLKGAFHLIKKILYLDGDIFSPLIIPPTPRDVADPQAFFNKFLSQ